MASSSGGGRLLKTRLNKAWSLCIEPGRELIGMIEGTIRFGSPLSWNSNSIKKTYTMAVEAYCVKCKAKREMKDAKEVEMANGRKAMKGTCPTCGTGMFKILGKA